MRSPSGLSSNVFNKLKFSTTGKAKADDDALAARGLKLDRAARALRFATPLALGSRLLGVASTRPLPLLCPPRARAHRDNLSGGTDLHRRAVEPERRINAASVGEDDDTKPLGAVRDDPRSLDGAARAKGSGEISSQSSAQGSGQSQGEGEELLLRLDAR